MKDGADTADPGTAGFLQLHRSLGRDASQGEKGKRHIGAGLTKLVESHRLAVRGFGGGEPDRAEGDEIGTTGSGGCYLPGMMG